MQVLLPKRAPTKTRVCYSMSLNRLQTVVASATICALTSHVFQVSEMLLMLATVLDNVLISFWHLCDDKDADNLGLPLIDMCTTRRDRTPKKALVQSPSFPIYKPNLDCSYRLDIDTDKAVNVYIVRVNLAGYKILNPSTKM
jgi:hypothetical protein